MFKNILIGAGIVILVAAALYYFLVMQKAPLQVTPMEREKSGLGSELFENPGTLIPETNPFKNVETNPLKGTNPFEGGYQNPFE